MRAAPLLVLPTLLLTACVLAGCGGSSSAVAPTSTGAPTTTATAPTAVPATAARALLASATARTAAAGPVQFTLTITATVAGSVITAEENGTASFSQRRAHLYKQIPGSTVPQELILIGPFTYTNANVQAALSDPTVKPWTKLDTRRLTAKQRHDQPDEFAHVLAPAYLALGVTRTVGKATSAGGLTRVRGRVDPVLLDRRLPAARRAPLAGAVRNDYATTPFPATFWLDSRGRLRRVLVDYRTAQGTHITVNTSYSAFRVPIDVTLPAPGAIADITP